MYQLYIYKYIYISRDVCLGRRGRANRHWRCEFEFHSGEVYSIQRYMIKFVCDMKQVGGFFPGTQFSSTCLESG